MNPPLPSGDDGVPERAGLELPVEPVRTLDGIHLAMILARTERAYARRVAGLGIG